MATTSFATRRFETRHDLDEDTRAAVVDRLQQVLADTTDLQTQVKHAHWNVKGLQFQPLHELFDAQAALLADQADRVAERATALGGYAPGTARMAAAGSSLPEFPDDVVAGQACLVALADRFAAHAETLRTAIDEAEAAGDRDTADLYTEISREIDKQLWFLEAHLQGAEELTEVPIEAED